MARDRWKPVERDLRHKTIGPMIAIIAKVTRDRIMYALAGRYPNYRWDRNVGYATLAHIEGMAAHEVNPAPSALVHSGETTVVGFLVRAAKRHRPRRAHEIVVRRISDSRWPARVVESLPV